LRSFFVLFFWVSFSNGIGVFLFFLLIQNKMKTKKLMTKIFQANRKNLNEKSEAKLNLLASLFDKIPETNLNSQHKNFCLLFVI